MVTNLDYCWAKVYGLNPETSRIQCMYSVCLVTRLLEHSEVCSVMKFLSQITCASAL